MNDGITLRPVRVAKPTCFYMQGAGLFPNAYSTQHNSPDGMAQVSRTESFGQGSGDPDLHCSSTDNLAQISPGAEDKGTVYSLHKI